MIVINPNVVTLSNETLARYRNVEPATIGHFKSFGFNTVDLHLTKPDCRVVGRAVTMRIPSMDSTLCHKIAEYLGPGDILMIDRAGDLQYAPIGGGVAYSIDHSRPEAVILDGAMTDVAEVEALSTPFFYRRLSAITTRRFAHDGEINTPINCCGAAVNPGDIVVADRNGFVVLKPEEAVDVFEEALRRQKREEETLKAWIDSGKTLASMSGTDELLEKVLGKK